MLWLASLADIDIAYAHGSSQTYSGIVAAGHVGGAISFAAAEAKMEVGEELMAQAHNGK